MQTVPKIRGKKTFDNHPSPNNLIRPGTYTSVVTKADWAAEYVKGEAVEIQYRLMDEAGKEYQYHEIFFWDEENPRTAELCIYLCDNGIESLSEFVGCKEELTMAYTVKHQKRYIQITNRVFLGREEEQ